MKFITTKDETGKEEMFLFPDRINHDTLAAAVRSINNHPGLNWVSLLRRPVAAGFIVDGKCCGRSETLGLDARPEDSILLVNQMDL